MSHVAIIVCEIRSLEALKAACARLGLEFREGQLTYEWYKRWIGDYPLPHGFTKEDLGHCEHAIRVPGATYEVGVVYREGKYTLLWDFYSLGGLKQALGEDGQRLVQAYTVEAAKLEAVNQGYTVWEEQLRDHSIRLHVQV